ncbi:MAG: 4-carboxymuconolactone decarboxylase [Candidatus Dormibacter sp.]
MTDDERRERGMKARREVLGDAYVDHSTASATPLTKDFQDVITRYAWGEIWTRPGLDRRIRSCITVAMTVALNRPDELALHLRGALRNGVTVDELREVLLQTAVYCGVPAAHTAFRIAEEVLSEGSPGR